VRFNGELTRFIMRRRTRCFGAMPMLNSRDKNVNKFSQAAPLRRASLEILENK
jgi:hypothetical protein